MFRLSTWLLRIYAQNMYNSFFSKSCNRQVSKTYAITIFFTHLFICVNQILQKKCVIGAVIGPMYKGVALLVHVWIEDRPVHIRIDICRCVCVHVCVLVYMYMYNVAHVHVRRVHLHAFSLITKRTSASTSLFM